ncbi:G-protein coupled receptor [Sarocladium implicatum]|nr:G-protein coupled receptor [Sarocladium implicatum]
MALDKVNLCPAPLWDLNLFSKDGGFTNGRFCQRMTEEIACCLPCPITDWVYADYFDTMTQVANGVATASALACIFLLLSWLCLPVEKTNRHYLSVCLTTGVFLMNLGFVIPLVAQPDQCYDTITPHGMASNKLCGASGTFILLGGFSGLMWAFMRSLSLHLQICWQVLVGRNFMFFAQGAGWGVPILGVTLALVFSGVSFRFGPTCHINHENSLADFWIPLLVFAALTVIITFATFGYCVKVYLQSLGDNSASTENSGLPTYPGSVRTYTPRQAYRRVRRVIALQWRGICIVLIIIADVIFFSIIFVFQDTAVQSVKEDPSVAEDWILCLLEHRGDKNQCLHYARKIVVNEATVMAVLLLLALNGIWLLLFLGRWAMVKGWIELAKKPFQSRKAEFVSVDARYDTKQDSSAYEMLSHDKSAGVTPLEPVQIPRSNEILFEFAATANGTTFLGSARHIRTSR